MMEGFVSWMYSPEVYGAVMVSGGMGAGFLVVVAYCYWLSGGFKL